MVSDRNRPFIGHRTAIAAVRLLALVLVVAGCSVVGNDDEAGIGSDAPPASVLAEIEFPEIPGSVRVAMVVDLTTTARDTEADLVPYVIAAVNNLNGRGGLLGEPVGLEVVDGANDVDITLDAVEDQLRRGARLIIVGCEPETVIPAAELAVDQGVLVMSPCLSNSTFGTDAGDLAFALEAPDMAQGIVLADHAIDNEASTALTVSSLAGESSFEQCSSFSDRFQFSGGQITATVEYGLGGIGRAEVGSSVAQFEAPDVFVVCAPVNDLVAVVTQIREVDPDTPIFTGTEGDNLFWVEKIDGLSELTFVSWTGLYGPRTASENQILDDLDIAFRGGADIASISIIGLLEAVATETGSLEGVDLAAALSGRTLDELVLEDAIFSKGNIFTPRGLGLVKVTNGFPELSVVLDPAAPAEPPPPPPTTLAPDETTPPTTG